MDVKNVEKIIFETLIEMGIYVDTSIDSKENENGDVTSDDVDLRNYISDSIMFISFIIELEKKFDIEFPDELLLVDSLSSLSGFSYLLVEIINERSDEQNEGETEKTDSLYRNKES